MNRTRRGCRVARKRVLRAVDHELALEERFLLDEHLATCSACADEYRRALRLEEAFAHMPSPPSESLDIDRALDAIHGTLSAGADERGSVAPRSNDARVRVAPGRRRRTALAVSVSAAALLAVYVALAGGGGEPRPVRPDAPAPSPQWVDSESVAPGKSDADAEREAQLRETARVERELRTHLVAAFGDVALPLTDADVDAALERFDALTVSIKRWPLARIAAPLLRDPDAGLASRAARFLGRRGDRLSVSQLEAVLDRGAVANAAIRALGDLGRDATVALATALHAPGLQGAALRELARVGGASAAATVADDLARWGANDGVVDDHLDALAAMGEPAVASLLTLASRPEVDRGRVLACLERVDGAAEECARLFSSGRFGDPELEFEVCARLQPTALLPWIEERASEHRYRASALACLERWDGSTPIRALLELDALGWVPGEDVIASLRVLAERDAARFAEYARDLLAARDERGAEHYLAALVAMDVGAAAAALVPLALSPVLPNDSRQWAALAVGDLGSVDETRLLLRGSTLLGADDHRLFAACLVTIQRRLGDDGTLEALERFSPRHVRRVRDALLVATNDDRAEARFAGDAVELFRVMRALDGAFLSRNPNLAQSSL